MIIQQGGGGGGSIHRGKFELFGAGGAQIPRVIFAFPETNLPLPFVSGTISRDVEDVAGDENPENYSIDYSVSPPRYTGPSYGAPDEDEGKHVIRFDLPAAQNTKGKFTVDESVLKDLPSDLADAYRTPAEYAVTFRGQEVTTVEKYGFTLSWENTQNEDAYVGVILGYQLRKGTGGEVLKLGALTGPTIKPVFPFYYYLVAATPTHPDPEQSGGLTEWPNATLEINLRNFKVDVGEYVYEFSFWQNPKLWHFYHQGLTDHSHVDNTFVVTLANGSWNPENSIFTVTVPVGKRPGLLLGRYFLGIEQP